MINRSISVRFATIITILIAAISVFIYFYFPYKLEMQARKAIAEKATSISEMTAFSISPCLLFRDKEAAGEAIQGTLQNEDLAYVVVIDDGGDVFASFNEQTAREANYWKAELEGPVSAPGGYYRTVTPVSYNDRVIGQVYLGLSLEGLEADIEASRTAVALVSSLIFLFGMAAVFLISSLINKPLARLVNIVDRIARGDLSLRVKVSSKDEIGRLAGSLNSMIASLESAYSRLGNMNRLLEHEVAIRTKELRREIADRRKAVEQAQVANRAKSDFLANISHQISTSLSGAVGALDCLLDTELDRQQQDYTQAARISIDSLHVILNDILDFTRIEAGKLKIESFPFDLQSTVNEVVDLFKRQVREKDLQLIVEFSQVPPNRVIGDHWRLRQVLINLVGNAVKFTERGYVKVYVNISPLPNDKVHVSVSVQDTGIGIEQGKLRDIFEEFAQAGSPGGRRYGGTGLGLAISKQIVEMMGGFIGVSSRQGKGSIFWFTLKLPLLTGVISDPMLLSQLQDMNMLIVARRRTEREMLQRYAERLGMNTTAVISAEDAVHELTRARKEHRDYQFAVVDSNLPGDAAYDFLRRIGKTALGKGKRQLALLGLADHPGQARRMSKAGYNSYFFKPVSASQFLDMLAMILHARSGRKAARLIRAAEGYKSSGLFEPVENAFSKGGNLAHVLLAEENFVNRKLAVWMLNKLGCRVDLAANGEEAVRLANRSSYDLVLMDCQMPTMNGYEAAARIRRAARGGMNEHLPIIAVTASTKKSDHKRCLEAGMDDHVIKPIRPDDLKAILERWTDIQIEQDVKGKRAKGKGQLSVEPGKKATQAQEEQILIEMKSSPVLDPSLSSIMIESNDQEKMEIIKYFKEDTAGRMESLGRLLLSGDLDEASIHTYNLLGSAVSIGAERFIQTCQETHLAIKEKDLTRSRELFGAMTKELQILRQAIDYYLKGGNVSETVR